MASTIDSNDEYQLLETRLRTLLPENYQESYQDVQPVSMGSADLKLGRDGRVLWDEIWGSFCHLAWAGGPPHRGNFLEPGTKASIDLDRTGYLDVVKELCRGVEMVSGLAAEPSSISGWIHVDCPSSSMAGWLVRAINMENVAAHSDGMSIYLPASPHFRLEKEIKNVITSFAKTCHYWLGHTSVAQHRSIADLFSIMDSESPLIQPPFSTRNTRTAASEKLRHAIAQKIQAQTSLQATGLEYHGWLGINCLRASAAIWMMRIMVSSNVLCRCEGEFIYVPVNLSTDRTGHRITALSIRAFRVARTQGVF